MATRRKIILFLLCVFFVAACGSREPQTPVETFKTYVKAFKNKDIKTMKVLLSNATIKMHEQEAKAQNTTVDEIIKRETLLADGQKGVDYKDEKIEGDKATLQFKNSFGVWETMPFVREDGVWKIDKQGYADQMLKDAEESDRKLDDLINSGQPPVSSPEVK